VNIILFGPPGVGKGTQADNLVKDYSLFKISTGDLLRDEVEKKTVLSEKIISKILIEKKYFNRLIFDGYPRNLSQAKNLDLLLKKYHQKISCVLGLNADKKSIIKRILGRLVCTKCGLTFNKYFNRPVNHDCDLKYLKQRTDDNENTIENRFEEYAKKTLPILDYYSDQGILYKIDGTSEIKQVYKEICDIIGSLET